jgi:class 3 adenylate cyclase
VPGRPPPGHASSDVSGGSPADSLIGVRVMRCFSFLDLSGFTAYTETHGDEEAVRVLSQLRTVLRRHAESHGVRVTKWLGDGAMVAGTDTPAVVDFTLEVAEWHLEHETLPLRAGVADGPVIMFEGDDYVGAAVNLAARLGQIAAPGQVLISGEIGARLWTRHPARAMPPVPVPGFTSPVPVSELLLGNAADPAAP